MLDSFPSMLHLEATHFDGKQHICNGYGLHETSISGLDLAIKGQ